MRHDPQLKNGKGYDHNWVLNRERRQALQLAARVVEPKTGRTLDDLHDRAGRSSSTRATSSTARSPGRAATSTDHARASASRPRATRVALVPGLEPLLRAGTLRGRHCREDK